MPNSTAFSGEIILKRNNLLTELPFIGREFKIKFDLFISKYGNDPWYSVIHLTLGNDMSKWGDRNPAVFISGQSKKCQIWMNWNPVYNCETVLPVKKWIKVEICQEIINNKAGDRIREGRDVFLKEF